MGRRGRPPYQDVLTPREWEVLQLIREGLNNPEIADRLGISRDGAKYHVSEILTKLGLSSREEAALWHPSERPWGAAALAPAAFLWRRGRSALPLRANALALAFSGGLLALVLAGAGLTAFLLLRGGGSDAEPEQAAGAPAATIEAFPVVPTPDQTPLAPTPAAGEASLPLRPDDAELYVVNTGFVTSMTTEEADLVAKIDGVQSVLRDVSVIAFTSECLIFISCAVI